MSAITSFNEICLTRPRNASGGDGLSLRFVYALFLGAWGCKISLLGRNGRTCINWFNGDSKLVQPHGPCNFLSRAGAAPSKPPRPISRDNSSSAAIRFSVDGWVENKLSIPRPDSGLIIKRGAVVG